MRYLCITEYDPETASTAQAIEKADNALQVQREKYPDRYPKRIVAEHYLLGDLPQVKGLIRQITIYETDNSEQLANIFAYWTDIQRETNSGALRRHFIPVVACQQVYEVTGRIKE